MDKLYDNDKDYDVVISSLNQSKVRLFNLFSKLDITLLRLGLMALSIHDKQCNSNQILDCEDLLIQIKKEFSIFYSLDFQKNKFISEANNVSL